MIELKAIFTITDCYGKETKKNTTFSGETKEDAFKSFYEANRHLRYCNGHYYKFENKEDDLEYWKWYNSLSKSTRFNMYYGDGIVD